MHRSSRALRYIIAYNTSSQRKLGILSSDLQRLSSIVAGAAAVVPSESRIDGVRSNNTIAIVPRLDAVATNTGSATLNIEVVFVVAPVSEKVIS